MTVVEAKLKLIKVTIKMLCAHLMVRTDNRPLKETPHVLKSIRRNDAAHVLFLKVTNRSVKRVFGKPNTTAEKVTVLLVLAIGLAAGLINWYLMDPGYFER